MIAAGCFWGVQNYFDQVPGVTKTTVGYTGGHTKNPSYDEVATQKTGHAEAVLIEFDPEKVDYKTIIKHFFRMHDPTQVGGQGPDVGPEYRSVIFYFNADQHREAIHIRNQTQEKLGKPVTTSIEPHAPFYRAEEYHQKFTEKTGIGICHIPPVNEI